MDGLTRERIEIEMIKFSGPAFAKVDNRLMSLQLVQQNVADAAMFTSDGEAVIPSEVLYKKSVAGPPERAVFVPLPRPPSIFWSVPRKLIFAGTPDRR